jgi:hypothetical protein
MRYACHSILHYDEHRRPRRDAPAADSFTRTGEFIDLKNLIAPPCLGEALRWVTLINFNVFTVTLNSGCPQRDASAADF